MIRDHGVSLLTERELSQALIERGTKNQLLTRSSLGFSTTIMESQKTSMTELTDQLDLVHKLLTQTSMNVPALRSQRTNALLTGTEMVPIPVDHLMTIGSIMLYSQLVKNQKHQLGPGPLKRAFSSLFSSKK